MHILLVEDNVADVEFVREALDDGQVRVALTVATTGAEAWRLLTRQNGASSPPPDLIVLDLNLPGIDGRQLLARIRAHDTLRTCPVIVFSSSEADRDVLQCYELGANCYIRKPLNYEGFITVVEAIRQFWLNVVTLPPRRP